MVSKVTRSGFLGRVRASQFLQPLLFWMVAVFVAGFIAAWETRIHRDILYFGVFAPALLYFSRYHWRALSASLVIRLLAVFLGYLLLSLLWSGGPSFDEVYNKIRYALIILSAVAVFAWVFSRDEFWLTRFLAVMLPAGVLVLIFSVLSFYSSEPFPDARLNNLVFYHQNPNSGAVGYYLLIIVGVYGVLAGKTVFQKYGGLLAVLIGSAFLMMAQSRGLIVGAVAATMVQLIYFRVWKILGLVLIGGVAFLVILGQLGWSGRGFFERADSYRFEIWALTLDRVFLSPAIGHGIGADVGVTLESGRREISPHNFVLMVLFVGGGIGGLLLVAILGRCVWVLLGALGKH